MGHLLPTKFAPHSPNVCVVVIHTKSLRAAAPPPPPHGNFQAPGIQIKFFLYVLLETAASVPSKIRPSGILRVSGGVSPSRTRLKHVAESRTSSSTRSSPALHLAALHHTRSYNCQSHGDFWCYRSCSSSFWATTTSTTTTYNDSANSTAYSSTLPNYNVYGALFAVANLTAEHVHFWPSEYFVAH